MINGIVTDDGVPITDVEVGGQRWLAIVDTGFNGDLELPKLLRLRVNAQYVGRVKSVLAANKQVKERIYLVDFPFDGQNIQALASFVNSHEILIGTGLLREYQLRIDFPARTVAIERA